MATPGSARAKVLPAIDSVKLGSGSKLDLRASRFGSIHNLGKSLPSVEESAHLAAKRLNGSQNLHNGAPALPAVNGSRPGTGEVRQAKERAANNKNRPGDVQMALNIQHFELLQKAFQEADEDGSGGLDIDEFREAFGEILGGNLSYDKMTMLFMKIDANSDGTVDWVEFSTYMMLEQKGILEQGENPQIFDEKAPKLIPFTPHKEIVRKIDYINKERKYITVGRDGIVGIWTQDLRLQKKFNLKEAYQTTAWVTDAAYLSEQNKLAIVTDDRVLSVYDVLSLKPRCLLIVSPLENMPTCINVERDPERELDLICFGDDGGFVNVISLSSRFFIDNAGDTEPACFTPADLLKHSQDFGEKTIQMMRRKVHKDWVYRVRYYSTLSTFISCSADPEKSLVISDWDRKSNRRLQVTKGIKCFEYIQRPSFIVTSGRDKIIRLWNPYLLAKPAGQLKGHTGIVSHLAVNNVDGQIISISEDRVIKVWDAMTMNCLQTLAEKGPEISCMHFDLSNRQIVIANNKLEVIALQRERINSFNSHDGAIVSALFNDNFHQVVSGCRKSTINVWDIANGDKTFQFANVHDAEITAMAFDGTGRRLITGSRDGIVKMWNFNNGQNLKRMIMPSEAEVTDIIYLEMGTNKYILCVGWDRRITMFLDDPDHFEADPVRVLPSESSTSRGHHDDILSVAFWEPNVLATSSSDGEIIIWNLESGFIKHNLKDPRIESRSLEERAIEVVLFMKRKHEKQQQSAVLVSAHADGRIRFWNTKDGILLSEYNCETIDHAGISAMILDTDHTQVIIGDTKGFIKIMDVNRFLAEPELGIHSSGLISVYKTWQAHVATITSMGYVPKKKLLLTSSTDMTIRVWSILEGGHRSAVHIGIFGQENSWSLDDSLTFSALPRDVLFERDREKLAQTRKALENERETTLKSKVIEIWKAQSAGGFKIPTAILDDEGNIVQEKLEEYIRERAIEQQVLKKWRNFMVKHSKERDWSVTKDLIQRPHNQKFFSYAGPMKKRKYPKYLRVRPDSIFHSLQFHHLEDAQLVQRPALAIGRSHSLRESESLRSEDEEF